MPAQGQADEVSKNAISTLEDTLQENGRINALGEEFDTEDRSPQEPEADEADVTLSRASSESVVSGDSNTTELIRETINGWKRAGVDMNTIISVLEEEMQVNETTKKSQESTTINRDEIHEKLTGG